MSEYQVGDGVGSVRLVAAVVSECLAAPDVVEHDAAEDLDQGAGCLGLAALQCAQKSRPEQHDLLDGCKDVCRRPHTNQQLELPVKHLREGLADLDKSRLGLDQLVYCLLAVVLLLGIEQKGRRIYQARASLLTSRISIELR